MCFHLILISASLSSRAASLSVLFFLLLSPIFSVLHPLHHSNFYPLFFLICVNLSVGVPNTVEELIEEVKNVCGKDGYIRLQYQDTDFGNICESKLNNGS